MNFSVAHSLGSEFSQANVRYGGRAVGSRDLPRLGNIRAMTALSRGEGVFSPQVRITKLIIFHVRYSMSAAPTPKSIQIDDPARPSPQLSSIDSGDANA
jgi:hypothetical protein